MSATKEQAAQGSGLAAAVLGLPMAREVPVELSANGQRVAVLMCTPDNLDDLAAGHLFTRGMLSDPSRILTIGACADLRVASVVAPGAIGEDRLGLAAVIASGCGSGSVLAEPQSLDTLPMGYSVRLDTLKEWSRAMFARAILYRQTGGMHCAALAIDARSRPATRPSAVAQASDAPTGCAWFVTREDVGRHNAVDKVLGRAFMDGVDFSMACLLTSGRIAADMILKAVAARVPVVVSRSIPTTTAYEIAVRTGITIVGRIGSEAPLLYCGSARILTA
jgi:FdhD protein